LNLLNGSLYIVSHYNPNFSIQGEEYLISYRTLTNLPMSSNNSGKETEFDSQIGTSFGIVNRGREAWN